MESIIDKYCDLDMADNAAIYTFYKDNKLYFDNYQLLDDFDDIANFIGIKIRYCQVIEKKGYYDEAIKILVEIYELLSKLKDNSDRYDSCFEMTLFLDGILQQRKRKFSMSNVKFRELMEIDPQNEIYKDWYNANKNSIIQNKTNTTNIIILVLWLLTLIFGNSLFGKFSKTIMSILLALGLINLIISFIYQGKKRNK